jgi:integrase
MQTRKRKPIKPKTAATWNDCLRKWLNPNIGEMPLTDVNNLAVKGLVSKMSKAGLSAKSIQSYVQVVKMVVASSVTEEGERRYPRQWNHEFIDLPVVQKQRTPVFTGKEISRLIDHTKSLTPYRVLFALLAGTGLRIGEALGLPIEDIAEDRRSISIRQSVWNGRTQSTKTLAGVRIVDLHASLAALLNDFIGDRTGSATYRTGFLFATKSGRPMSVNNVLNRHLNPALEALGIGRRGFHAFRRFRVTQLRKNRVPEDLIRFWLGHANRTVTDGYSRLKEDVQFRREWAERVGVGFLGLKNPAENGNQVAVLHHSAPIFGATGMLANTLILKKLGL